MKYHDALRYLYSLVDYEKRRIKRYTPEEFRLERVATFLEKMGNPHRAYPKIHIAGTKGKGSVAAMLASVARAAALIEEIRPLVAIVPGITIFEVATALAFRYFARRKVDLAVVEVGLGGRLDATNVITPLVSVITSLSLDHTYLLGNTLAAIAREKAGIIKY